MKYQCLNESCKKVFTHPAKQAVTVSPTFVMNNSAGGTGVSIKPNETTVVEKHQCPFCGSIEFSEYVEPQPEIQSIKSVDIEEADDWLAKGYKVLDRYAKSVTVGKMSSVESRVILVKEEKKSE